MTMLTLNGSIHDLFDIHSLAAYGHNYAGERYMPVLIKDVAGLVPGAWEGKGRGNRFLNDLLDADVLMHIVDVSGRTNEKGEETTDYDPAADIQWLQQELQLVCLSLLVWFDCIIFTCEFITKTRPCNIQ